jgi:hypothetical protein
MIICVTKHRNEGNAIDQPSNNIYIYIYISGISGHRLVVNYYYIIFEFCLGILMKVGS